MILVIGSINMDISFQVQAIPRPGETVMASGVKKSPGGKGANQACAASRLGGKVIMLGCIGLDENGKALLSSLNRAGVDTSYIKNRPDVASSSAFICVASNGDNSIVVDSSANALVTPSYLLENEHLFAEAEYCVLQMEIPRDAVAQAVSLCKKHNVKIVFNPSPLASFDKSLLNGVDYLIPNETEASELVGTPYEHVVEAEWSVFMKTYGIENLIVTLGRQGCRHYDCNGISRVYPSEKKNAIDTTGAGDTFLGALVAALSHDKPLDEAIIYANTAAGIEITRYGAQEAMPTKEEVEYELEKRTN